MLTSEFLSRAIKSHVNMEALSLETYEARGIFHSEMAAILGLAKEFDTELFIETGRARGQSTYILGKYLPSASIISVDLTKDNDAAFAEDRVASLRNVELVYGDAFTVVPNLIKAHSSKSIALLIDGPKYVPALELLQSCFRGSDNIKVGFIHDLSKDRDARYEVPDFFENYFFTDDPVYVEEFKHLDKKVFGGSGNWRGPFQSKNKPRKSYGPTLGIFVPSPGDEKRVRAGPLKRLARRLVRGMT